MLLSSSNALFLGFLATTFTFAAAAAVVDDDDGDDGDDGMERKEKDRRMLPAEGEERKETPSPRRTLTVADTWTLSSITIGINE